MRRGVQGQFRLKIELQVGYLVEKKRTLIGFNKCTVAFVACASECATRMPEHFRYK